MKALLFPGQGVQKVGMLNFLLESDVETRNLFAQTSDVLDFDLIELIKIGPDQKLNLTEYAQPAILASSVAIARKKACLLYTSPSPRDLSTSRMPSSA